MTNLSKQQIKFLITCGVELCAVYGFCCQLGNELEQVSILGIGENKVQPLRILEFGKKGKIVCWLFVVQIHFIGTSFRPRKDLKKRFLHRANTNTA